MNRGIQGGHGGAVNNEQESLGLSESLPVVDLVESVFL
jgi:hypothetical protein